MVVEEPQRQPYGRVKLLGLLLLFVFCLGWVLMLRSTTWGTEASLTLQLYKYLGITIILGPWFIRIRRKTVSARGSVRRVVMLSSAAYVLMYGWQVPLWVLQPDVRPLCVLPAWRLIPVAVNLLTAPVAQELLFRGMLTEALERLGLKASAIVFVSAVTFGLLHIPGSGLYACFVAGVGGAVLSWAYLVTRSLSLVVAFHAFINLSCVLDEMLLLWLWNAPICDGF